MILELPDFCLVLLMGASGSGKSRLAAKIFAPDEVLSADNFRKMIGGDETDQSVTEDAFDCLYRVAQKRADRRKLTVIDATNLNKWARKQALEFAKANNCFACLVALGTPEAECLANNAARPEKNFAAKVIKRQCREFPEALKAAKKENFRRVYVLSPADAAAAEIVRRPLWTDKSSLRGPFDIIGDIHGCYDELCQLLRSLGYEADEAGFAASHPEGRTAVFLGDLCDRGPNSMAVYRLVMNMTAAGRALCVPGNHDDKFSRYLEGKNIRIGHGLELTIAELEKEDAAFKKDLKDFLRSLVSHYLLDDGALVVCHAGLPENLQARSSAHVREFCLYGDPSGEKDEYGLPIRNDWARDYSGKALVAYGHCPEANPRIAGNAVCLDTGCVFGGALTALRYPEREFVSVPALRQYWRPLRPLEPRRDDSLPDAELLLKRQRIETGLGVVLIRDEDRSPAALEIMARFAVDPRWLVYLPPTMSPCDASARPDYLEHPEGVAYYKKRGVNRVICEEKHMGSRAIAIVCKDPETAKSRFAPSAKTCGMIYSRTGRPFFYGSQTPVMDEALGRLAGELAKTGFWDKYATDWVCLDCEIMPWSYKAAALIDSQYAPYGIAGINGLDASLNAIKKYARRMGDAADPASLASMETLSRRLEENRESLLAYNKVWRSYCAPATSLATIRIAPFHILATENKVWSDLSHDRHLAVLEEHLGNLPFFAPTRNIIVDLDAPDGVERATAFWLDLTAAGAEGMVVEPLDFIARRGEKLLQPAIKIRGKEYLRLIYGAAYADKLESFKKRELAAKRKRAVREFALGLEGLDRFVRGESLHKVHECAFTILALEGEPQDARL